MYESFYQLRERPFALTPDPDYLYPSRVHQEALSYLRYGVESQAGFVVITGEIGSGKTTLLQALLNGLDADITVARLVNTMLEPHELLETIAFDLGLDATGMTKPAMLRALARFLVAERQANRLVLLVIDEAQNLGLPALEEIRMLSNLETEKSKLIQVVLVGQPDLRDKLQRRELEQLRQRITVSYHLGPLDEVETAAYVNHRLRRAAIGDPLAFPRAVTDRIYAGSKGLPRLVNVICDATLVFGYAEERRAIDTSLVEEVLGELADTGVLPREPRTTGSDVAAAVPVPPAVPEVAPARPVDLAELASAGRVRIDQPAMAPRSTEREQHLRSREEQIAEREREVAEQKRVLADECRLLRERFSRASALAAADGPAWPPLPAGTPGAAPTAPRRQLLRFDEEDVDAPERERVGFWRRMRTLLISEQP
jgi:general secretion pathway protein A